jgi:hypothetical protein
MDEKKKWALAYDKGGKRCGYMTSNMAKIFNSILRTTLEVCNTGGHHKKTETPFNCALVFHFQKAQHRFRRIAACCGCRERVVGDVYHTTPVNHDFGAEMSYSTRTSSTGAAHDDDDDPDLGLDFDIIADVLSQLEDAPDPTQPSHAL